MSAPTTSVAGLLVDDWTEVIPDDHVTTSVAFHYDAPSSAAPNVMLLGVPTPGGEWSADDAVAVVLEALDLARLRAVDPDALTDGAGQLLPALFSLEHPTPGVSATLDVVTLTDPV